MQIEQEILSQITVHMKYAKFLPDLGRRETYEEIVDRNKEMHIDKYNVFGIKEEIEHAYELVYAKKLLPSMRSMQFAGKPIEINPSRIYNCAYLPVESWEAFHETMFLLLGGTGVGYSVQRHHVDKLPELVKPLPHKTKRYLIGDSIEGWADAIKVLTKSYFFGGPKIRFDYSDIRPKGARLVTSGGKAPGPAPLKECLVKLDNILDAKEIGSKLTTVEVHDIICHIADAVLAGGIRRAALIALFSAQDADMMSAKTVEELELNPQRYRANNSVVFVRHKITKKFFKNIWKRIEASKTGEPGIYFTNDKDWGSNPCCEIALRPYQFCNLVEINGADIEDQEDLNNRSYVAGQIATLQAGYTDFHYLRPIWKDTTEKDALIGVSLTGIASMDLESLNLEEATAHVEAANAIMADLIGINRAARLTAVKPAGTTSLVLGTSSGIHAWHNEFYLRRMRVGKNEAIYQYLATHHPEIVEDDFFSPDKQAIISLPQKAPAGSITREESVFDLLERVKKVSESWVRTGHRDGNNTHNVSATISVKDNEWDEVGEWMWKNRDYYNGLAVLPFDGGTYKQAPFEDISESTFYRLRKNLTEIDLTKVMEQNDETDLSGELACQGGACEVV
jgi:ribonucleoside-triphosphate reductase